MAQHDFVIDNGPGLAVRTDINAALAALVQQNSGPVEPTVKYPGQFWLDTTVAPDGLLRMRNQANSGWVTPTVQPATAGNIVLTVLTTSGTWTKPTGLKFLEVYAVGGGGGGAGASLTGAGQVAAGGGGGGAGTVYKLYQASALSATEAYTIGAAGATNTTAAGGTSTFKTLSAAGGGGGGNYGVPVTVFTTGGFGVGGGASGGDLNIKGEAGTQGLAVVFRSDMGMNGAGGGSYFALRNPSYYHNVVLAGSPGAFPGGGGSGQVNGPSQTWTSMANVGGVGAIIIKEIF